MSRSIVSLMTAGALAIAGAFLMANTASAQGFSHFSFYHSGFGHGGFGHGGFDRSGFDRSGFNQPVFSHSRFGHPGFGYLGSQRIDRDCPNQPRYSSHYRGPDTFGPDVFTLGADADSLAQIAEHLHDDACQLSQGYEHSRAINVYVSRLERLQKHMHSVLHRAGDRGIVSRGLLRHIESDVLDSRRLALRLDAELSHQTVDGADTNDFNLIQHMRQIIAVELFPLLRKMEAELGGVAAVPPPVQHDIAPPASVPTRFTPDPVAPIQAVPIQVAPIQAVPNRTVPIRLNLGRKVSINLGGWSF